MHQKITLLVVLILIAALNMQSQSLDWAMNLGGHTDEYPRNVHVVPGGIILNSSVDGLRKYDEDGNLVWKFNHFNHVHGNYYITSSDVDEVGNIYVGLSVGGQAGTEKEVGGFTFQTGLNLVKLDPEGNILWTRKTGGSYMIVKYHNRKIYLTGHFYKGMDIGDVRLESQEYYDCFSWIYRFGNDLYLARYSDIGVFEKAVQYGYDYHDYASSMEIDEQGNVFIAAMHEEYACVTSFSYLLRFDRDLNHVWEKKVTTQERDSFLIYPLNLYLSENGKLYLVTDGYRPVDNEEFTIPNPNIIMTYNLMEYDPGTGDFLRLNSYAIGNWNENFVSPSYLAKNLYVQDYKEDLIVFTSSNRPLSFANHEFVPQESRENLILFRVNKKDFTSHYITHFEAETNNNGYHRTSYDNPGRTIVDGDKIYLTASFQSSPLHMFGEQIPNNSGNNDRDVLLAKLDIGALAKPGDDLDDDGDGVPNYKDYCPDTSPGTPVNAHGCSELQMDSDGDGVINSKDDCPDTRPGAPVNEVGCEILILPANNFRISSTAESCVGKRDAIIKIEAANTTYNYRMSFNGGNDLIAFTDVAEVQGLGVGTYEICITAEGFADFERCFNLVIERPESLEVFSVVNVANTSVELLLKGGEQYTIIHNDRIFTTAEGNINLNLEKGLNKISVSTEKGCQGVYEEVIHSGNNILLYPNPVDDHFMLDLKTQPTEPVTVTIYTMGGKLLKSLVITAIDQKAKVDATALLPGTYLVQVTRGTGTESFKIIKK